MLLKFRKNQNPKTPKEPLLKRMRDAARFFFWQYERYHRDRFGTFESDLFEAARFGHYWAIKPLLKKKTVGVNATDKDGDTPLIIAVSEDYPECCRALLENGADPFAKNKNGTSAMALAIRRGNDEIVPLFMGFAEQWLVKSFGEEARPFYKLFRACIGG